jgi:hypothetical protein
MVASARGESRTRTGLPPVDFEFFKAENRGLRPTAQVLPLQYLGDRVLSRVVYTSPEFGHSSDTGGPSPYPPPTLGRRRRRLYKAGSSPRAPTSARMFGAGDACLSKNHKYRRPEHREPMDSRRSRRPGDPRSPHGAAASGLTPAHPLWDPWRSKRVSLTLHSMTADGAPSTSMPTRTRAFSSGWEYPGAQSPCRNCTRPP